MVEIETGYGEKNSIFRRKRYANDMDIKNSSVAATIEYIVGCKWSLRILTAIREGVNRPGAITRSIDGLTTKVQGDCLNKMVGFGILERIAYGEIPPRVEYKFTVFGERFSSILDAVKELQQELDNSQVNDKIFDIDRESLLR